MMMKMTYCSALHAPANRLSECPSQEEIVRQLIEVLITVFSPLVSYTHVQVFRSRAC